METIYDRLIAQGAPALPSAMSYRIEQGAYGDLVVDVVALKRRGKSELVARRRVDVSLIPVDAIEGAIVSAAIDAWGEVRTAITRTTAAQQLVGTHGPELSGVFSKVGS